MMMMGYGYYGNGGSSSSSSSYSSSNLSALAPPFSVDRFKTSAWNHLDVAEDSIESTYATVSRDPTAHNWIQPHPPSFRTDFFSIPNPEFGPVTVTPPPCSSAYGYSPATPYLPPPVRFDPLLDSAPTDVISCGQSLPGSVDAKPYYPSYGSPAIVEGDGSYAFPHHFGYDLLSSRSSTGSTHNDYSQSVSALATSLSAAWQGFGDCQRSQQVQLGGAFSSEENYVDNGLYASEGLTSYENAPCGIDGLVRQKHFESTRRGWLDSENFLLESPSLIPVDYPMVSNLESTSVSLQTYRQVQLEGVNSRKQQMLSVSLHERCSTKSDGSSEDSISAVKSPAVNLRFPGSELCLFTNHANNGGLDEGFVGPNPSSMKEPHLSISSKGKPSFDAIHVGWPELEQNDHLLSEVSSSQNETPPCNKNIYNDDVDPVLREKESAQSPCISTFGFNLTVRKEAINSVENFADGIDYYNPVVDSPCWKGASLSSLYPFEFSEVPPPKILEKLDSVNVSSGKANGNAVPHDNGTRVNVLASSLETPSVGGAWLEAVNDTVKSASLHTKFGYCHGVHVSDDINEPRKDNTESIKLHDNSDCMPLGTEQQGLEKCKYMPRICAPDAGVARAEMKTDDNPNDSPCHVPCSATESIVYSPPSAEEGAAAKLKELHGGASMSKVNVRMVVDTLHNLSELLLFHCLNDASELVAEDMEVLKDVINNLGSCMLKNKERMTSAQDSLLTGRAASVFHGELSNHQKDANDIRPQMSRASSVKFQSPVECQHIQKDDANSYRKGEKTFNFNPARVGGHMGKDDSMTQAIRKILTENFHVEEDSSPQVRLYKNLWLEAEASLSSVNYVARFNRMKIEMEESKLQKAIDNCLASPVLPEKPKFGESMVDSLKTDTKGSRTPDVSFPDLSILSTASNVDDVMTRFHILKSRDDDWNSVKTPAVDKLSSFEVSPDANNVEKSAQEVRGSSQPPIFVRDSPTSDATGHADDLEASTVAEFHVLTTQNESLGSMVMEGHQPDLQGKAAKSTGDKSIVKEVNLFVKDNPQTQSSIIDGPGYQPHAGWYDNSTSDWEHILKEELAGRKC